MFSHLVLYGLFRPLYYYITGAFSVFLKYGAYKVNSCKIYFMLIHFVVKFQLIMFIQSGCSLAGHTSKKYILR